MEPTWELTLLLIGFGLFLGFLLARASFREARTTAPAETPEPAAVPAPPAAAKQEEPLSNRQLLLQAGRNLSEWYSELSHPSDLATSEPFNACVEMMVEDIPLDEVYGYLSGDLPVLSCAAATALARRKELVGKEASLVHRLQGISIYARFCLMAAIARDTNPQTAWSVLLLSDPSWRSAMGLDVLRTHLAERLDAAHAAAPEQQQRLAQCPEEQRAWLRQLLEGVDAPGTRKVLELLQGRGSEAADTNGIREFARVLQAADVADAPQPSPTQSQTLKELAAILAKEQGRSILLVGDAGVGKSTVTGITVSRLLAEGWTVFEASAAQVLAGQSFIGQIEQRIQDLLRAVGGRPRVLWIAHDLFEFAGAGRTMQSRTSILDLLLPSLLAGELRVLAPLTPASCENLLREAPQLRDAVTLVRLPECSVDETFALARAWIAKQAAAEPPICEDRLLLELNQRAQQYLAEEARPGNLLKLLGRLREHVLAEGAPRAATLEDVVALLSRMSGLPAAVLDDRDGLDLPALRSAFQSRVMGQPEAVDCLVERIAMLKAGLCDPKRPIGVFLFTGPTGTGKTELCRALAEYMFGGAQRMLRLDMSEYQHPESIGLLLGDSDAVHGRKALVHRIREQPFSVVLFDEIEKAHPMVFDLLLQVFDEGRLTDRRGRIANFRHAILIATSNLGVHAMEGAGLGFGSRGPDLHGALEEVFRREFLNRIDRIVMFRSLDQETMRQVLHKELDLVLQRRGLRERPWAVEWDESALQFLLAQGWSPTLGARPLRRAIERHVLAPLAAAIVGQSTPEGDQFLLVHSDGKTLQVEFIDPEEPAPGPAPTRPAVAPAAASLRLLAREGAGTPAEVAAIQRELAALQAQVAAPRWAERKAAAYAAMGEPDFWTSARRHEVLSRAETMSRIEEALTRASERAAGFAAAARPAPTEPLRRLAARVLLLQLALDALEQGVPQDAYVSVAPVHDPHGNPAATAAFARQLSAMYRAWAELRGMELRTLDDPQGTGASVFAVAGFAAFTLLGTEAGLHVLDADETRRRSVRVRVAVAAQPTSPVPEGEEAGLARDLLAASHSAKTTLVRRYRQHPTPEIRDRVRGWRTGKWARVFEGEFDAME